MAVDTATRCDQPRDPALKERLQLHTHSEPEAPEKMQLDVPLTSNTRSFITPQKNLFPLMYIQKITQEHSILKRFVLQADDSSRESTEINACGSMSEEPARQGQTFPEQDELSQALLTQEERNATHARRRGFPGAALPTSNVELPRPALLNPRHQRHHRAAQVQLQRQNFTPTQQHLCTKAARRENKFVSREMLQCFMKTAHGCLSEVVKWPLKVKECCSEGSDLPGSDQGRESLITKGALKLPLLP